MKARYTPFSVLHTLLISRGSIFSKKYYILIFITLLPVVMSSQGMSRINIFLDQANWEIPFELLHPSGSIFSPIGLPDDQYSNVAQLVTVSFDFENNKVNFPVMPQGVYKFYYNINNRQYNAIAYVVVTKSATIDQGDCCPEDCNLICNGNFSDYPMLETQFEEKEGIFEATGRNKFRFTGYNNYNLAHITAIGQNRMLKLSHSCAYLTNQKNIGAYVIKLRTPIAPNKTAHVKFKAAAFPRNNSSGIQPPGKIRFYALENDISPDNVTIPYPGSCSTSVNLNGNIAYCMMTNVPTPNGISISSFGSAFDGISLGTSETCDDVTFADNVARTLDNYSFIWTNNTNKDLSYILIITGQECGSLPLSSSQNLEQCILVDYLIDDIEVKTNEPAAPICITGNQIESCTGNTSHLVNFQVCWCSKEGSGSRTFRAKIDQNYNGINVVLPSGNFDVNGEATVTIPSAGACTNLSVEINIPAYIEAGTIPLKLRFDEGAGCTICNSGFFISLNNPVNVILTDCPFTCPCAFVNIGVKNSTIYWSSLTESQKNAHCIAVEGTLNFDVEDLNVSGKHFYMQNDASIKINNNTTFTNCYFTGCELLWQGINVVDDLYLNNCVVEDARVGVNRVDDVSVILLNSQFFNNYIGVNLHNGSLDLKDSDYKAYIANCTFSSDGLLQDPELKTYNKIGFAGIKLDYFTEQLGTTAYGNSFSNLGFGIISYIANTTVHASTFENILDVNYYNFNNVPSGRGVLGLGVKDLTRSGSLIIGGIRGNQTSNNNFNNCKIAINCEGELHSTGSIIRSARIGVSHTGTPFKSIFCTNNDIEASNNGIRSYGGGYLETLIADNLIKEIGLSSSSMIGIHLYKSIYGGLAFNSFIRDNEIIGGAKMDKGIFLFNMGGYSTTGNLIYLNRNGAAGIYIAACKSQSIKENIINNSNNKQNTVGLYLSKLEKTLIECNHIDNTAIGLEFSGQNTETDIVTNLMQSSTSVGLHCSGSATVESNRSDNIQYLYGNRWDNVTGVTAIHEGTNTQVQKTLFRTNSDILPIFPVNYSTPNVTNNVEWFKSNFGTEDLPFECMFPSQNLSSTTWLDSHALSAVNYMVYDTMLKQQGHQLVYNYICEHPGLNYSVGLQNFFTNYSSSSEGKINNIMNRLNRELGGSNTMDSAITRLNDSLKNYSNLLNSLQLSLGLNPTQSLINSYKIQSYLLSNKFDSINSQIKILLNDHHNDLQDSLEVYYEQLSLVAPPVNNIPMENAYTALHAYISYLLDPDLDFSNGVMQNLLFVANQCPDYGGKSVYMARALVLHSLPNMHWDDALLCLDTLGNNSIRRNEQQNLLLQDTESLFAVSPNPSNGRINVMASDSFNGTIKIFDMYGNKIMQHDYSPELQLTINNYSGVFFVVWEDNNHQVVHLNRVFILK